MAVLQLYQQSLMSLSYPSLGLSISIFPTLVIVACRFKIIMISFLFKYWKAMSILKYYIKDWREDHKCN